MAVTEASQSFRAPSERQTFSYHRLSDEQHGSRPATVYRDISVVEVPHRILEGQSVGAQWSFTQAWDSLPHDGLAPWLDDALRELDDIGEGMEMDGPPPTAMARREARALIHRLAISVSNPPDVGDDPFEAVAVEFCGPNRNRVLFVVERDGAASYFEHIGGRSGDGRFENWKEMMEALGWQGLRRAGFSPRV